MEMSGQHHVLVNLPPGKKPDSRWKRVWAGPKASMDVLEEKKISLPRLGFELGIFESVAHSLYRRHYIFKHVCIYKLMTQMYVLGNSHVLLSRLLFSAYGHGSAVWESQQMMYLNMATQHVKTVPNIVQSTRLAFVNLCNCDYVFRLVYCC
jgi:hypothetical protein